MSQPEGGGRFRAFLASYWTPAGKQALRNLIGLIVCTGISQACALGVLLILTHGMSQAAFGAVIFALNVQTYLVTLGTFGLTTIVVRDLTQQPEKANETTTAFLTIVGVASLLTGILTAVVAALVPITWDERVMLWCVAAGNVFACLNLNPLFDAAHRQALAAALMVPGDVLAVSVIGGLSAAGLLSVPAVGFAILGRWFTTAVLQAIAHNRIVRPFRRGGGWERMRRLLRAGRPMVFAGLIYTIPMGGSVVLVRLMLGEAATAIYGLAFQILFMELLVVAVLQRILQPHISGPHGLSGRFLGQLALLLGSALGLLTLASLTAGWVLFYRILGPEYEPTYEVLAVLQLFAVLYSIAGILNLYLLRFHCENWVRIEHVFAAVLYLGVVLLKEDQSVLFFSVAGVVSSAFLLLFAAIGFSNNLKRS